MCSRVLQRIQVRDMGLQLAELELSPFYQVPHQHPSSILPDWWEGSRVERRLEEMFQDQGLQLYVVLNTFGCDCYVQHGSVCVSTFLQFHVTKLDEAVRRLPTKNRLELFIKNIGFRGVVLMDRIVFTQRCNRGRILFGMLEKCRVFCIGFGSKFI